MRIKVVDYVLTGGGGARFVVQLLRALQAQDKRHVLEFVSHGPALAWFSQQLADHGVRCTMLDIPPRANAGFGGFLVSPEAIAACDVAWFPWIHHHRLHVSATAGVVGSFHDALIFTEPTLIALHPEVADDERCTVEHWLASPATLVCSSHFSRDVLSRLFSCRNDRVRVVPLAANHLTPTTTAPISPHNRRWMSAPFLLCPANTSRHKNHEVLFEGYARAGLSWPLVLTGVGTDLIDYRGLVRRLTYQMAVVARRRPRLRGATLKALARTLRLQLGTSVIPLGYLSEPDYDGVIDRATCVVMPTLGEGGGSFPVEEAVLRGVPVICSDIPVMREHMDRLAATVLWFDPQRPDTLADRLVELRDRYPAIKTAAADQVSRLRRRGWADVAAEYMNAFERSADQRLR